MLSLYEPDKIFKGAASTPEQAHLRTNCDHVKDFNILDLEKPKSVMSSKGFLDPLINLGTGKVASVALVAMVLILVVAAFVLKRKLYRDSLYYVSDSSSFKQRGSSIPLPALMRSSTTGAHATIPEDNDNTLRSKFSLAPVPIDVFLSHVEDLSRGDGFAREFSALQEWEKKRMAREKEEKGG
jgi:hypothetical protein